MQSALFRPEQSSSKPVAGRSRKIRPRATTISRPLTFNDAHSPALVLDHAPTPSDGFGIHVLQAKLTINEPGDQYEQEADRVAEQVMRMHEPAIRLQRKCGCGGSTANGQPCDECAGQSVQLKQPDVKQDSLPVRAPAVVNDVLRSSGYPLDGSTRAFMESRFRQDFGSVRLHTDTKAAESAQAVNALAYTVGHNMVFGAGQFAPDTERGRRLIAHELTHVVQQGNSQPDFKTLRVGSVNDPLERQAEHNATSLDITGASASVNVDGNTSGTLQRLHPAAAVALGAGAFVTGFGAAWGIDYLAMTRERAQRYARDLDTLYPGWLSALPDCPCTLPCETDNASWLRDTNPNLAHYHPGATYSCRSSATATGGSRHGQQCTYDSSRRLITSGAGAGTPDVYSPSWGILNIPYHTVYDVKTWQELGWATYNRYWRPNIGRGCETSLPAGAQRKLAVNTPGDRYEQEADSVAEQIMSMANPAIRLQRKCDGDSARGQHAISQMKEPVLQRFGAEEHRSLGNEASNTMIVNIGGTTPDTQFELQFGDVVALSADLFEPHELRRLAAIPGNRGTRVNTRDEIIYALHSVRASDPRFAAGGIWAGFTFPQAVMTAVNNRYQRLAAANTAHFAAPRGRDATGQPQPVSRAEGSAGMSYRDLHESAIITAYEAGRTQGTVSQAMGREAAAQHFLSDAFSAGHIRTPIGLIRDHWNSVYPLFWYNLRHKLALDTAIQINDQDNNLTTFVATVQMIYETIIQRVEAMVQHLPQVTLGDLLAKIFHDFDNAMGLSIGGGQMVWGDSNLDNPDPRNVTRRIAVAAMRAGIQDITEAFRIGQAATTLTYPNLFDTVRSATGAPAGRYVAETRLPQPDPSSPSHNWRAPNFESLWTRPMVGTTGPTVGSQITASLQPGREIRRQLDDLALQFDEVDSRWSGDLHPRRGYLQGFVIPLARNPYGGIHHIINWAPNYGLRGVDRDDISVVTGEELDRQRRLGGMTTIARARYIRELIDGSVGADEEALVVRIFETAPPTERPRIYQLVEGHPWTGNWIEGVFVSDDDIWNALNRPRLARLRTLINAGWSGRP
jgi:uncharacterized protein DUF4157/AMOP domain-containing protein